MPLLCDSTNSIQALAHWRMSCYNQLFLLADTGCWKFFSVMEGAELKLSYNARGIYALSYFNNKQCNVRCFDFFLICSSAVLSIVLFFSVVVLCCEIWRILFIGSPGHHPVFAGM